MVQDSKFLLSILRKSLLTHPEVVHDFDCLLKLYGNVYSNIVVETRSHRKPLWERRPVVFPAYNSRRKKKNQSQACELLQHLFESVAQVLRAALLSDDS